jgi:putative transposase
MAELISHAHSYGQNCYHFIWAPKYRIPFLKVRDIRKVCEGVLRMIAIQKGMTLHELRVMEDHIHCFIEIPPRISVSQAFQYLKGKSARILRRRFHWLHKFDHLWSKGKFFRSVGNVTSDVIENYIAHCQGNYNFFNVRRKYLNTSQARLQSF